MAKEGDRVKLKNDPTKEGTVTRVTAGGNNIILFDDEDEPRVVGISDEALTVIPAPGAKADMPLGKAALGLTKLFEPAGDDDDEDDTAAKAKQEFFGILQRLSREFGFSDDVYLRIKEKYTPLFVDQNASSIRFLVNEDFRDMSDYEDAFQEAALGLLPKPPEALQQLRKAVNQLAPSVLSGHDAEAIWTHISKRLKNLAPADQGPELERILDGGLLLAEINKAIDAAADEVFDRAYRIYILAPYERIEDGFPVREGAPLPTTGDIASATVTLTGTAGLHSQKPDLRAKFREFYRRGLTMPAVIPGAEQLPFDAETFRATAFETFFGREADNLLSTARPDLTFEGPDFILNKRTLTDSLDNLAIVTQLELRVRRDVRQKIDSLTAAIDRSMLYLGEDEDERFELLRDMKDALVLARETIADGYVRSGAPEGVSVKDWVSREVASTLSPLLAGTDLESLSPDAELAVRELSRATIPAETERLKREGLILQLPEDQRETAADMTTAQLEAAAGRVTAGEAVEVDLGKQFDIEANVFAATLTDVDQTAFAQMRSGLKDEFIELDGGGGFDAFIGERLQNFIDRAETQAATKVTATQRADDLTALVTQRIEDLQARLDLPQFQSEADQAALTADIERLQGLKPTIGKDFADLQAEIEGQATPGSQPFGTQEFFEFGVIPGQDEEGRTVPLPPVEFVGGPDAAQASIEAGLSPLAFAPRGPLTPGELPTVGRDIEARFKGFIRNLQFVTPQIQLDPRGLPVNPGKFGLPTLEEFNRQVQVQAVSDARRLNQPTQNIGSVIMDQAAAQVIASIRGEGTIDRPGDVGATEAAAAAGRARSVTPPRPPTARVVK